MIFLFFGTSLAILEAELAPSKDWQEIEFLNVANFLSIFKRVQRGALFHSILITFNGKVRQVAHLPRWWKKFLVEISGGKKISRARSRCFKDKQDPISKDQLKNQIYLIRFGHTKALLFEKI